MDVHVEELATRLEGLEREKGDLEHSRKTCRAIEEQETYDQCIAGEVVEFSSNFEDRFEQAPLVNGKLWLSRRWKGSS